MARGRRYEIPQGYTFTFDEQAGTEQLFIIVSRQPERDLEELIYSLREGAPATPEQPKMLLAANRVPIEDGIIGRLRNAYSRDLIIEKVNDRRFLENASIAGSPVARASASTSSYSAIASASSPPCTAISARPGITRIRVAGSLAISSARSCQRFPSDQ